MVRLTLTVSLTLLTARVLAGQASVVAEPQQQPGAISAISAPRVQRPARDPSESAAGTAVIRGRVIAADTGTPLRRAQVRAFSPGGRESRGTSTDAQGRFELRDLPAGRWELMASKAGYVPLRYGQRRPREAGQPIELAEGETMARADIALPHGAVVTGRILDEFGDPVAGARVQAMRYQSMQGTRQLVPAGGDTTDDTGAYRIFGLMPGDYYVTAVLQGGFFGEHTNDTTGYASTYYPGTANAAEAQRVAVTAAQELSNVTFALLATRAVRVSGTVVNSKGERISSGFVSIQDTSQGFGMPGFGSPIRADGTFVVSNVTPGTYTLSINTGMGPGGGGGEEPEFASLRVVVGGDDLSGIHLVTSKGTVVSGSVLAAPGSAGTPDTSGLMVMHQPATPMDMRMPMGFRPARVERDGTFRITGVHGQRLFRVSGLPPTWTLKAVLLDGDDITDRATEFGGDQEVTGLQVLVTDRVTEVSGRVTDAKGAPTKAYTVVIFPEDATKWGFPSRFVRSGRPDQDGVFKIRALPPDERYLAVAVDSIEEGEGGDPDFLEQMRDRATPFLLGDGETKTISLKVVEGRKS